MKALNMAVDSSLLDILKELQNQSLELAAIRTNIAKNSSSIYPHVVDFLVIFLADICAALILLFAIESRREARKEDHRDAAERAKGILEKLGPHMRPLIQFLEEIKKEGSSVLSATPWASERSRMRKDFSDPILQSGSLNWQYPGGEELSSAVAEMLQSIKSIGQNMGSGPSPATIKLLEAVQKVDALRRKQVDQYAPGSLRKAWLFFPFRSK